MQLSRLAFPTFLFAATLTAGACRVSREHVTDSTATMVDSVASPAAAPVAPSAPTTLGPGDMRITTTDGSVDLLLVGDRIAVKLSDSVLADVKQKLDTTKAKEGLGAFIEKTVKSTVSSALSTRVEYPLADVKDARYEDGKLVLEPKDGGKLRLLEGTKVNGRSALESFRPDDARRFAAAVKARLQQNQ
jgi:hypothetical protein